MPNLLWFKWQRHIKGYEILRLDPDEVENELHKLNELPPERVSELMSQLSRNSSYSVPWRVKAGASYGTSRVMQLDPEWMFFLFASYLTGGNRLPRAPISFISPLSEEIERTHPLDESPALFMEFSELRSTKDMIRFANRNGLLLGGGESPSY